MVFSCIAIVLLFRLGPHSHVAALLDFNVDYIRSAADRTILDVLLAFPRRQVQGDHDLLAASIADVAGLLVVRQSAYDHFPGFVNHP